MFGEPIFHSLMYLMNYFVYFGIIESTPTCMPIVSSIVASVYVRN